MVVGIFKSGNSFLPQSWTCFIGKLTALSSSETCSIFKIYASQWKRINTVKNVSPFLGFNFSLKLLSRYYQLQ